jgi:ATP-binding cassette, subfamily C (CFTR/MRP), member 1
VFAIQAYIQGSDFLDTVKIFTNLALINLVAYPAARLLSAVPLVAASLGSFQRIQEFLQSESVGTEFTKTSQLIPTFESNVSEEYSSDVDRLLDQPASDNHVNGLTIGSQEVLEAKNLDISTPSGQLLIKDLTFKIPRGSIICITGPIGSGKSTLLKVLLGHLKPTSGIVYTFTPLRGVSYCAQTPWIPHGTIKDVICRISSEVVGDQTDEDWYHSVIEACALSQDLDTFATGDTTIVGSRGMTLSGGQKQRVALARALYHRSNLLMLDDVFSSLDSTTKDMVIRRLLGRNGLFRMTNATVVIVSYEGTYRGNLSIRRQHILTSKHYRANSPSCG